MRSSFHHHVVDHNDVGDDYHDNCDEINEINSEISNGIDGI